MSIYPKVGIRPIIDGRLGGIRESLEATTMNMALKVAELFKKELRYPDGSPVECVIADTCIGGVKEAADCAEKFKREDVGVSLRNTVLGVLLKQWIWIPCCLKRSALMAPSVPVLYI